MTKLKYLLDLVNIMEPEQSHEILGDFFTTDYGMLLKDSINDLLSFINQIQFSPIFLDYLSIYFENKKTQQNEYLGNMVSDIKKIKLQDRLSAYYILAIHSYIDVYATTAANALIEYGPKELHVIFTKEIRKYQNPVTRLKILFGDYQKKEILNPLRHNLDEYFKLSEEIKEGQLALEKISKLRNIIAHNEPMTGENNLYEAFRNLEKKVKDQVDTIVTEESKNLNQSEGTKIFNPGLSKNLNISLLLQTITVSIVSYLSVVDEIISKHVNIPDK